MQSTKELLELLCRRFDLVPRLEKNQPDEYR